MSKIIITGNAGLIGSHLADNLLNQGHDVLGVDDLSGGNTFNIDSRCQQSHNTLGTMQPLGWEMFQPDILVHCAADAAENKSQFSPMRITSTNIMAAVHAFTEGIKAGVKKIVFTSSMAVYGHGNPPFSEEDEPKPVDIYGWNKYATENILKILCQVHGINYCIVRPHNVFGERQNMADPYRNVVAIFMNRISKGEPPIIYGDGEQTRAFTYIRDFTPYLARLCLDDSFNGETFNLGSTREYSVNQLADMVLKVMGSDLEPIHYPDRSVEVKHAYCTNDKAEKMLGYKELHGAEKGIEAMGAWAQTIGAQEWKYQDLEIPNEAAPKTWTERKM